MADEGKGHVSDELWEDFHRAVNMTSRELADWLRTDAAGEAAERLPDEIHEGLGEHVVAILGKRRGDLTPDDVDTMGHVVAIVDRERGDDFEPTAGDAPWRHKLMSLGHDPMRSLDA